MKRTLGHSWALILLLGFVLSFAAAQAPRESRPPLVPCEDAADAPENTGAPFGNYPFGTFAFEDSEVRVTVDAPGVPPMCQTATHRFHVYRYGSQNVALLVAPIDDECAPRLQDMGRPIIWVAGVD